MSDASFDISYAVHTATCTFLLDADGICRRVVSQTRGKAPGPSSASRAVGAQYVASLDPTVRGMLAEMPRVGSAMLFARVDERGRISLVRTGVVTRFEHRHAEDPFAGVEAKTEKNAPSMTVETSAPEIPASIPTPRFSRPDVRPEIRDASAIAPKLRPEELKAADRRALPFGVSGSKLHSRTGEEEAASVPSSGSGLVDDATIAREQSGWVSKPAEPRRAIRPGAIMPAPLAPTLRPPLPTPVDDELDAYGAAAAARSRAALPRPTPPPRLRSERVPRSDATPTPPLDRVAGSRRDR